MVSNLLNFMRKPNTAEDPVCHMEVDVSKPAGSTYEHQGQPYYFCGPGCRIAFSKDPEGYLSGEKRIEM